MMTQWLVTQRRNVGLPRLMEHPMAPRTLGTVVQRLSLQRRVHPRYRYAGKSLGAALAAVQGTQTPLRSWRTYTSTPPASCCSNDGSCAQQLDTLPVAGDLYETLIHCGVQAITRSFGTTFKS